VSVRRFGMACRLVPELREEYLRLHAAVWPGVAQTITECGIRNFSIFERDGVLFGYYEYVGDDYEADQRRMADDPVTREWWARTDPCQLPFVDEDDAGSRAAWQEFTEVWHQD
jgi:L-rhamnose mutarotase